MKHAFGSTAVLIVAASLAAGAPAYAASSMMDESSGKSMHHGKTHHAMSRHHMHASKMHRSSSEGAASGESGNARGEEKSMNGKSCGQFMYRSGGTCMDARNKPAAKS